MSAVTDSLIQYFSSYRPYLKTAHSILYQSKTMAWKMLTRKLTTVAGI